jgi:GH15 family glucan-1,4-alpha-glucosidase
MPRDLPLGNGNLLINFDLGYNMRDIYYPHVGQENHARDHLSHFGVWVNGKFAWIDAPEWQKTLAYDTDTLVTRVVAVHREMQVELLIEDAVDYEESLFLRRVTVRNGAGAEREVRLFFHLDLHISGSDVGDTAYFDPEYRALVSYKGGRYFWVCGQQDEGRPGLSSFATGAVLQPVGGG